MNPFDPISPGWNPESAAFQIAYLELLWINKWDGATDFSDERKHEPLKADPHLGEFMTHFNHVLVWIQLVVIRGSTYLPVSHSHCHPQSSSHPHSRSHSEQPLDTEDVKLSASGSVTAAYECDIDAANPSSGPLDLFTSSYLKYLNRTRPRTDQTQDPKDSNSPQRDPMTDQTEVVSDADCLHDDVYGLNDLQELYRVPFEIKHEVQFSYRITLLTLIITLAYLIHSHILRKTERERERERARESEKKRERASM